jgi:hypothetical protein
VTITFIEPLSKSLPQSDRELKYQDKIIMGSHPPLSWERGPKGRGKIK